MDFIQQNLMLVILVVTSGAMLLFNILSTGRGAKVNNSEATALINKEDAHVLDVREAAEFATSSVRAIFRLPSSRSARLISRS